MLNYLKDGRLELSNNRVERSIKPFVIGWKNFLFANAPNGAKSSAVIFSLIQTAAENGLDPYRYLTWLSSSAAETDLTQPNVVQLRLLWNLRLPAKHNIFSPLPRATGFLVWGDLTLTDEEAFTGK